MSQTVISVSGLSKRYILGQNLAKGDGLRHQIEKSVRGIFSRSKAYEKKPKVGEFWALNDVNFNIKQGETVGIIGRNGAGKSTLLKLLSRITEPTRGSITLRGRVASLLEVGTGFHPELTGRENIYLNGAILGMGRAEINRKLDEIISFAEIEKFLDTPVKRYSSGMYVRLAFAVAAHLEPEILIVDEVLAVGDAQFQKKCLDKMDDASESGRTVLFVSHNMQAVMRLCGRCILLDKGNVAEDGDSQKVTNAYMGLGATAASVREWADAGDAPGDDVVRLRAVRVRAEGGELNNSFDVRNPVGIEIEYEILEDGHQWLPHFQVVDEAGNLLFISNDLDSAWRGRIRPPGRYCSVGWISGNLLVEGSYFISVVMMTLKPLETHLIERDSVIFRIVDPMSADDTARGDYTKKMPGLIRPILKWETKFESI